MTAWTATPELRWICSREWPDDDRSIVVRTLQQKWVSTDGDFEWRDVPDDWGI